ncbi:MAG: T9SS type A sorting domain-containing protein [Flavobacteriales bacterium]|nr:T9SS type A sorting domain-containing protein [Flavobacteriales bacterium]
MKKHLLSLLAAVCTLVSVAQIYEPEGVNIPGSYDGWVNVPTNLAFANGNQASGGRVTKISSGTPRWQTIFSVAASGADITGGSYEFKFTSGPSSNYWNNGWGGTAVSMNTLQSTFIGSGTNNSVTYSNGKWYTVNFMDYGYVNSQMIVMETAAEPITFTSVSQLPLNGSVDETEDVVVSVNASAAPSAGEIVYLRYSTNGFATSTLVPVSFTGALGEATIPGQSAATIVDYYIFSTTVSNPASADVDKVTIRFKNNGAGNYNYTVNTPLPPVDITFQVDMSQQTVGGAVNIAGSFNGWTPTAMTNAGGGVYTYMAALNQGANIQYKFVNGASYEGNLGAPCGNGSDRAYTVGTTNDTIPVVCFGSCSTCPASNNVTFRVNMTNETVGGNVYINGSFPPANWSSPQLMTNAGGGVYTYTTSLPQGASYEYKFINGASYEGNLGAPCGNGNNRTISVPASASTTLPVACFSYCDNCIVPIHVTFNVNMSGVNVSPNGVHIAGNFASAGYSPDWSPSINAMTDPNGDGVYSITMNLFEGNTYEYKFINGNAWGGDESVPGGCNSFGNRYYTVTDSDVSLPAVCLGSCSNCVVTTNSDTPYAAATVYYSSNVAFPNCYAINGNTSAAGDSPQSSTYSGNDLWYKFTAQSSAVSITLTSATSDDVIELYSKTGDVFTLMPGGSENASSGASDFERLNYGGLTPGITYYISVGSVDGSSSGPFTLCIQHLMPSGCSYTQPLGGFPLCGAFKAIYRGTPAQGVTYDFSFTGVGGGAAGTTSLTGTNGLITLSHPTLGLRYGGIYDITVNTNYALQNSAGTTENILVNGSSTSTNCASRSIAAQPSIEVKNSQRCPSVLLRSHYLIGTPVTGSGNACGAVNYTFEFTPIDACGGSTTGFATEYTTALGSPYLALGVLPNLPSQGAWRVRIRPNFSYGIGTYGPPQDILVNGTAAISMPDQDEMSSSERSLLNGFASAIYPNPCTGDLLHVNITGITGDVVNVRVLNHLGQQVYNKQFSTDGVLNTVLHFDETLATGLYVVEFSYGTETLREPFVVQK